MIKGSIVALITPFDNENRVNYEEIKKLCKYHLDNATDGLCLLGTTAEAEALSENEKLKIIECVIKETNKRIPIIVGLMSNNADIVIDMAKKFEPYDIDSYLVISPYYIKTNETGIIKYFTYIADNVNKPIIIYNVPSRTGMSISFDCLRILALHKNIMGIKEASGDLKYQSKVASLISEKFYLYSGDDQTILASLGLAASGYISVIANAFPKEMKEIYDKYNTDRLSSMKTYYELLPVIDTIYLDVSPIGIKYLMYIIGFDAIKYRRPLDEPSRNIKRQIEEECYKYLL